MAGTPWSADHSADFRAFLHGTNFIKGPVPVDPLIINWVAIPSNSVGSCKDFSSMRFPGHSLPGHWAFPGKRAGCGERDG